VDEDLQADSDDQSDDAASDPSVFSPFRIKPQTHL